MNPIVPPRAAGFTRRHVLGTAAAAGLAPALARPALAQSSLKGTKLSIFAGKSYVPDNDVQFDQLVVDLAKETGMEIRVERFAGDQLPPKIAAVVGSGRGADIGDASSSTPICTHPSSTT